MEIRYEIKKLLSFKILLAILLLLLINGFVSYNNRFIAEEIDLKIYRTYMDKLTGEYSEEGYNWISNRVQHYEDIMSVCEEKADAYISHNLSREDYQAYLDEYNEATIQSDTARYILNKYEEHMMYDNKGVLFFDFNADYYIKNKSGINYILVLMLIILLVPFICNDEKKEVAYMIKTTKNGRKNIRVRKTFLGIIISGIISSVFLIEDFFVSLLTTDFGDMSYVIHSIDGMEEFPYAISIKKYVALTMILRLIFYIMLSCIIMGIALLINNIYWSGVVVVMILLLPEMIKEKLTDIYQYTFNIGLSTYDDANLIMQDGNITRLCIITLGFLVLSVIFVIISNAYRIKYTD
ncbi:MAG: hypothetical protein K6G26_13220 [Lachnospiraceae bacterium]|nr:hypothetical protein [Lachnospiraceae bacterium]